VLNVLSLFTGIGGLDLGLERAGMRVVGQVEIDPYCQQVLAKHWPEVPQHDDVRTAPAWWRSGAARPAVHVVAGGFPCQPFSKLGHRLGTADQRWGWPWMRDVIRAVRPDYVLVENVADLLADRDAFGRLLGDLADLWFDAEWSLLSACAMGAPHTRERLFVVAYPEGRLGPVGLGPQPDAPALQRRHRAAATWADPVDGFVARCLRGDRVADGSATGVDRRHALGNAVVPQVAEHAGRLIVAAHQREVPPC
jgi:DNA (cytosine-5)-methyltransferase 1